MSTTHNLLLLEFLLSSPVGENHAFRAKKFVEHSEQHVAKLRAEACGRIISGSEDQGRETM